jgi:dihydrofolate reductase
MIAIAAMSQNRVIGAQGKIPWRLPEDFRWFKQKTMGGILVMGRKTYDSIGRPLPGRTTLVISRNPAAGPQGENLANSTWQDFKAESFAQPVFLCGGAEIYALGLPDCSELFLTRVQLELEGDTLMPEFETLFPKVEILSEHTDPASQVKFTIERYFR